MNARSVFRAVCLLGSVLLTAAVASACMKMDVQSDFTEQGGATHRLRFTMSKEALQAMGVSEEELQQQLQPTMTAPPGVTFEQVNTEQELGFEMRTSVDDASDLGSQLNELLTSGGEGTPTTSFSGSFQRDGNRYTLDLTFDADAFFNQAGDATGEQVPPQMLSQMLTLTYTARLPGEVKEHNGTLLEDGRVQWTLPYSGTMRMTVRSETAGILSGTLLLVVAAAAVGALALLGAGIVLATRRPKPAAVSAQLEATEEGELPPSSPGTPAE